MSGGGSDDPNVYSDAIFNFRRIRLAPTTVLIGLNNRLHILIQRKYK
jgi:hypothetical protein